MKWVTRGTILAIAPFTLFYVLPYMSGTQATVLMKVSQNLYAETAASGTPNAGTPGQNGLGSLQQGFVETSNVNVVEELVQMIQTQRAYELNSKAIQTSDQMLQKLAQL